MPLDQGGPDGCLVRHRTTSWANGRMLFICTDGGWDGTSMVRLPIATQLSYFVKSASPDVAFNAALGFEVMRDDPARRAKAISAGGAQVRDSTVTPFTAGWERAVEAVEEAKRLWRASNDCVMVRDGVTSSPVRLSTVMQAFPGYHSYGWMACKILDAS